MSITRTAIVPSKDLLRSMTLNRLKHFIPMFYQWFLPENLRENQTLGQFLYASTDVLVPWLLQAQQVRHASSLVTATGDFLDYLGAGYGVTRITGETDDDYANRIQHELMVERVTGPAILNALLQIVPMAEVFEPWRKLPTPSSGFLPSGTTPLPAPGKTPTGQITHLEYMWNAAVFEARIRNVVTYTPGLDELLQKMKAYGVNYWLAFYIPDQAIDYNDDPLATLVEVPKVPAWPGVLLPDPWKLPQRPNSVIGSTLDLITDIIPQPAETSIPSRGNTIPSHSFRPSGRWCDDVLYTLDMMTEYFSPTTTAMYAMDMLPIAILSPDAPNRAIILDDIMDSNPLQPRGYAVTTYDQGDLLTNRVIAEDVDASQAASKTLLSLHYSVFDGTAQRSDLQAACIIRQLP